MRKPVRKNIAVKAMVKQMINARAEHKNYINQQLATVISTVGAVINLSNTIIQGDNYNNRSGSVIRLINQKFIIRVTGVTFSSTNRFILFKDMENNGVTPATTDVLDAASFVAGYNSQEVVQQKRFVILKDWITNNNLNGETITSMVYKTNRPSTVYYNGPTAIASANGKGAYFLLAIGSSAAAVFDFSWQGVYTDS